MIRYFSIGSGSTGNCAYIGTDETHILLDAGFSAKRIKEGLSEQGISINDIQGILVTHEHRDHIGGLGVLMRKYMIPVYATPRTREAILNSHYLGKMDERLFVPISTLGDFEINDLKIGVLPISHDAVDPVAYRFSKGDKSLAVITDLGVYDENTISFLSSLDGIVIEANHDRRMLETGPYPYQLKRRIASEYGHLSNEDCGRLLSSIVHEHLKWIVLAHLSAENNYDQLALEAVGMEITLSDNKFRGKDFEINVAPRFMTGKIYEI